MAFLKKEATRLLSLKRRRSYSPLSSRKRETLSRISKASLRILSKIMRELQGNLLDFSLQARALEASGEAQE